jgi:glutamate--cysteine ligase
MLTRTGLADRLRRTLFGEPAADRGLPPRIGVEAELLAFDSDTMRVVHVADRLLPFLTAYGARCGWAARPSTKGAPRFQMPGGGGLALEPGGQLEYASPPHRSPRDLLRDLAAVVPPLIDAAADAGITLLARGIDPYNALDDAPLQLDAERYRMMDTYFATIGPAGATMMRQTASVQVNIDAAADTAATWRVLNAASPYLTALFANSARYAGEDTGLASTRAVAWRTLDPLRTGVLPCAGDIADEYAGFALWAPAMLRRTGDGEFLPFCEWVRRAEATEEMLAAHLTTLFPDVRPKRYFEVRSIDALPPEAYAAPVLVITGLTWDARARAEAEDLLGAPDPVALDRASRIGLNDPTIERTAASLHDIALAGCARLGERLIGDAELEAARAFRTTRPAAR